MVLDAQTIVSLKDLKYIGVTATGYNVVDTIAARNQNIPVTNVPAYGTRSVAQMVFAHLLELAHHVGHHTQTVREGKWTASNDFCYWNYPLIELEGLTMGLVGFGRIGQATAALAQAFGMKVIVYDINRGSLSAALDVEFTEMNTLFKKSDVISLHCPLTSQNKKFINKNLLALMKPTAFLINTSRGALIDEQDLADALTAGQIGGAGLDVLCVEPPQSNNPLLKAPNCHITPHIAWATRSARRRLMDTAIENIQAFLQGKLQNVVN